MKFFAKAIITGFAFSLGKAIFNKVSKYVGLEDKSETDVQPNGTTDPNLRNHHA
jgi:hypothetical protein